MNKTLINHALEYAKMGWKIFPCRNSPSRPFLTKSGKTKVLPAKSPIYKGGFKIATTDEKQIVEWWTKVPNAAIGVSCGDSNLIVVDIDVHNGKNSGFDNWMKLNIPEDGTFQQMTPSGGLHIIFSGMTNSYANVKESIDLRSRGSYILLSPSFLLGEDGKKKEYIKVNDWIGSPAPASETLIEKLNLLRGKQTKKNSGSNNKFQYQNPDFKRVQDALNKLPKEFCDERWHWVNVGLALKTLGEDAFYLFDKWSSKSEKYDEEDCRYVWDTMKPNEITIGSLFHWAREARNG